MPCWVSKRAWKHVLRYNILIRQLPFSCMLFHACNDNEHPDSENSSGWNGSVSQGSMAIVNFVAQWNQMACFHYFHLLSFRVISLEIPLHALVNSTSMLMAQKLNYLKQHALLTKNEWKLIAFQVEKDFTHALANLSYDVQYKAECGSVAHFLQRLEKSASFDAKRKIF